MKINNIILVLRTRIILLSSFVIYFFCICHSGRFPIVLSELAQRIQEVVGNRKIESLCCDTGFQNRCKARRIAIVMLFLSASPSEACAARDHFFFLFFMSADLSVS